MFKNAYQTTPCANYVLKDIVAALNVAMVDGQLQNVQTSKNFPVEGLFEVPPYLKAVAPFSHTIALEHFGKTVFVIDTRPFCRTALTGETKVVSTTEYEFARMRGALTRRWTEGGPGDLASFNDIAPRAFIRLLSEGIVRRLGLSPLDQQALVAITGYYYYCQFEIDPVIDEREFLKIVTRVARNTAVPVQTLLQLLDGEKMLKLTNDTRKLNNIHDYCNAVREIVGSPRLETFNPALLYTIVTGCWFGSAAREIVAVALEHPPTYMAMVYMALSDRSYHRTYFTELVTKIVKGSAGRDFLANLIAYLEVH